MAKNFRGVVPSNPLRPAHSPVINDVAVYRPIVALGNGGAAKTIDFFNGHNQRLTLNGATCALTLTTPPEHSRTTATSQFVMRLHLVQAAPGTRVVTWPAATRFAGGVLPVLSTATGAEDILELRYAGGVWNVRALILNAAAAPSGQPLSITLGPLSPPAFTDVNIPSAAPNQVQLIATGHYLGGATADVTASIDSWLSGTPGAISVTAGGLATGLNPGAGTNSVITATLGVLTATVTVDNGNY
jgi:hypothetical protein